MGVEMDNKDADKVERYNKDTGCGCRVNAFIRPLLTRGGGVDGRAIHRAAGKKLCRYRLLGAAQDRAGQAHKAYDTLFL